MKKINKIILFLGVLVILAFAVVSEDSDDKYPGDNETVMDGGGCPPECDWGCYPDGECCPEPSPGQPRCSMGV